MTSATKEPTPTGENTAGERLAIDALNYITARTMANDAWVAAQASEQNGDHRDNQRELFRIAHMLSEREEDYRRMLADSIIRTTPALETEVRKVCKFSASEVGTGVIVSGSHRN